MKVESRVGEGATFPVRGLGRMQPMDTQGAGHLGDDPLRGASALRILDFVTRKAAKQPDHLALLVSANQGLTYGELAFHAKQIVTLDECRTALGATRVDVLFTLEGAGGAAVEAATEKAMPVLLLEPAGWGIRLSNRSAHIPTQAATGSDLAVVLQTTGTTSIPKVVPLTHRNLCGVVERCVPFYGIDEQDRCLNVIPLFHIYGIRTPLLSSVAGGGSIACLEAFEPAAFFRLMEEVSANWYAAGPAIHHEVARYGEALMRAGGFRHQLRRIQSGGAPIPAQLVDRLEALFQTKVLQGYGLTETAAMGTCNPPWDNRSRLGSAGVAMGGEVRVADMAGHSLPAGQEGRILLRGPGVMSGYEGNEAANRAVFLGDWFVTGDQGYLDPEGYLFITGRDRDFINRGGQKVFPLEVEEALQAHPGVLEAVVFPMPHPTLGEAVAAAFVAAPGHLPTELALRLDLARRLATHKIPQRILEVPSIPKGPTGKVKRSDVYERFRERLASLPVANPASLGDLDPDLEARRTETALSRHPEILQCAVLPWPTLGGGMQLAAFLVKRPRFRDRLPFPPRRKEEPPKHLLSWLVQSAVDCVAPAALKVLEVMPMDLDGHIDRQRLAALPLALDTNPSPSEISEVMLAGICRSLLGVDTLGMRDNFFALGADSLKAVSLLHEIEREFGRSVSPDVLFRQPTLEGMLEALQREGGAETSLISVQEGASTPLCFLHGDYNGGGFHCPRLGRLLGPGQGLITFVPHGLPGRPLPSTIEAMVDEYLPLLRRHQPAGPYRLAGHCNGALVALEMAQRLTAEGCEVDRLILISPPPQDDRRPALPDPISPAALERAFWHQPTAVRRKILNGLYRRVIQQYLPRRYEGRAVLLTNSADRGKALDPTRGWKALLPQAQGFPIPGEHLEAFTRYLPDLANLLRQCLAES